MEIRSAAEIMETWVRNSNVARTPLQLNEDVERVCLDKNYKNNGMVLPFDGIYTKVSLTCKTCNHDWATTTIANLRRGKGCPNCKKISLSTKKTVSLSSFEDDLNKLEDLKGYTYCGVVGEWKGIFASRVKFSCENKKEWVVNANLVLRGRRCPCCTTWGGYKTAKPGYFYIQKLSGDVDAVKFGITNVSVKERMSRQKNKSKLDHELVFSHYFEDGSKALKIEKMIKTHFKDQLGAVSRELMTDGFTETLPIEVLPSLVNNVKSISIML
ncbi:hypothetical protein FRH79_19395 [Salmonella enterica]|nr:hypothetical protein [Salmonella enterica]